MVDNVFNIEVIFVGGGVGVGQYIFGVKDIQFFIFYCVYIEEIYCDDYIDVEVIFQVKVFFILFYGVFQ